MKYARTQVFKDSLAHESRPPGRSAYYDQLWRQQQDVETPEQVAPAIADFWRMVGEEMQSGYYFSLI